ncbi:MAG TPA: TadE/TadG family type IV pilus assembly protein [Micromonosporaceae bacterium]|nr:TadE/TadG family type IV pilus assembly protein [Micromonosporaceae bacterium]
MKHARPAAPRPASRLRGVLARDDGASPIELAILLPVIVLALFAAIQVSVYFLARSEALAAAEEAVTAQRAYQAAAGAGDARARAYLTGSGGGWLGGWTVRVDTASQPTQVTATVTGQALSLLPGVHFTVTQTAHGSVERVTEGP